MAEAVTNSPDNQKPLTKDLAASFVVFLVALPLSMGIAMASGVDPAWGLFSAIIGALVAGIFSGVPLQINGPQASLIVISAEIIMLHGLPGLALAVFTAGSLQFLAGYFRMGQMFRAVSPSVVQGVLTGVGALIVLGQLNVMMASSSDIHGIVNLANLPRAFSQAFSSPVMENTHFVSLLVGLGTIAGMLVWQQLGNKFKGIFKTLPSTLVAVLLVILVVYMFKLPVAMIDMAGSLFDTLAWPEYSAWPALLMDPGIQFSTLALLFISSVETMMVSIVVSRMTPKELNLPRPNYDKSLSSIGIGNMLCGLVGVLPLSGIIVRSSLNVASGAQSQKSSLFLGVWLLVCVLFFPSMLNLLPQACLAGILVYVGFQLIDVGEIKKLKEIGWSEVAIFTITVLAIVFNDLLVGLVVGFVLTMLNTLYIFSHLEIRRYEDPMQEGKIDIYLDGSATFMRLPMLAAVLEEVPPNSEVHIHIDHLDYIDHACLELLMGWEQEHVEDNGHLVIDWDSLKVRFQTKTTPKGKAVTSQVKTNPTGKSEKSL